MKKQGKAAYDTTTAMQRFEEAWPSPPPEEEEAQQKACLALLERRGALDLAPLLGVSA